MQQDSETILEFIRRTDLLADQSGLNLSELPEILGFSKPSLFAYRSGKNRITQKVWLKLERAEREAAGGGRKSCNSEVIAEREVNLNKSPGADPEKFPSIVREDETPYRTTATMQKGQEPEHPGGSLLPVLERIAKALEMLVEIEESRNPKP